LSIIRHASFRKFGKFGLVRLVSELHNISTNKLFKAKLDRNKVCNKEM